jgi:hypothetical protein
MDEVRQYVVAARQDSPAAAADDLRTRLANCPGVTLLHGLGHRAQVMATARSMALAAQRLGPDYLVEETAPRRPASP